jgi:hypothetical protein
MINMIVATAARKELVGKLGHLPNFVEVEFVGTMKSGYTLEYIVTTRPMKSLIPGLIDDSFEVKGVPVKLVVDPSRKPNPHQLPKVDIAVPPRDNTPYWKKPGYGTRRGRFDPIGRNRGAIGKAIMARS